MVLRASAGNSGEALELAAITDRTRDIALPGGAALLNFADAVLGTDPGQLDSARQALVDELGEAALVGAAMIAANFSRNDRIANAIGIPLEAEFVKQSEDFRAALGIDDFASARNTLEGAS